jgi:hypothetical protein
MRIRTIKPEFFTHDALFEAEQECNLPLRLAYVGLWCAADRDGRFRWEPRRLGVQILPYDGADFARILNTLHAHGFLIRYGENGEFGAIPSFHEHQCINVREAASKLPEPDDASLKRTCMHVHSRGEGKGREGNGREHGKEGKESDADASQPARKRRTHEPDKFACAVVTVSTDPELVAAWDEWQQYRQARHREPMNGKRIFWTEQAARLTARQVDEFARSHGARIVADRIRSAIAGCWQGLNLDKLGDARQARGGIMSDEEYQRQADMHKPDPNSKYGF